MQSTCKQLTTSLRIKRECVSARAMMFARGPFCAGCSQLLHVEPCRQCVCARLPGCVYETLERCVRRGATQCENGIVISTRRIQYLLAPKDVKRLAEVLTAQYPSGILVFHLAQRACCRIQHGVLPALVDLECAVTHLMASLAFVILDRGRGMAVIDISCV